jgi:hypothetical protein
MRVLLVLALAASVGSAAVTFADDGDARTPQPPPRTIHILVVGSTAESVRPVVDAFSRRDASLRLTHVPAFRPADVMAADEPDVAARAWIEVLGTGEARITIADQRATRFLVREVTLPTWPDEVARETIVQMVESSVAALLDDQAMGMSRAEASSMLAVEPARPSRPAASRRNLAIGVFYQAQLFSPQIVLAHGPGLRGQLTTPTRAGELGVVASAEYVLPLREDSPTVGVELQAVSLRAGAGLSGRLGSRLRLGGWLMGGADAVRVEPRQGTLAVATLTGSRWTAVTVLGGEVRASIALVHRLGLCVAGLIEWAPVRPHYDVAGVDGRSAVVDPYVVRPGLSLSLEWQ